jgi:hypothetical protein
MMEQISRIQLVKQLAVLARLIEQGGVTGFVLVAVHPNEQATVIAAAPETEEGVEKLMTALDRMHFRMQATMYLGMTPKKEKDGGLDS